MNFEEALTVELEQIPSLNQKVFPGIMPGKSAPYIAYLSSEGVQMKELGIGYTEGKTVEFTINIVTQKYGELKSLSRAVLQKLISFQSRVIGTDGPFIQEFTYTKPVELYEPEPKLYRCVIDCEVYF